MISDKILSNITIVLITYKSRDKVINFIKNIPKLSPIIIIDNSNDFKLKKKLIKKKNIRVYLKKKNTGYGSSINYACKKIKSKYFLAVQCDVEGINKKTLLNFNKYAIQLNDKFSMLGPYFVDAPKKGHIQSSGKKDLEKIFCVHGSCLFFNTKNFNLVKGFDKNYFLYWEERDLAIKFKKYKLYSFQINNIKVKHKKGNSVNKNAIKNNLELLYNWHFIWSKYYYYKKMYGLTLAFLYFFPIIIRINFRIFIYSLFKNDKKFTKYYIRWHGLKESIKNKTSYMRLELIKKFI
jgi:GT2 family glycosyltransferase